MQISLEDYEKIQPVAQLAVGDKVLKYHVPNKMTYWRVETLFTKEPVTIDWLNHISAGEILLDIGANVGMYSVYAAVVRGAKVVAIEPESQNFALLNANLNLNGISERATAYCLALSDQTGIDHLYLSQFQAGTSCHSLGEEVGFDLQPRKSPFVQGIMALRLDDAVAAGGIPVPDHIKIDVDGFEHKVIDGARQTLADPRVKSVIIELNPHLEPHRELVRTLEQLGFAYDPAQVAAAARKEGAFTGVGEWVFTRANAANVLDLLQVHTPAVIAELDALGEQVLAHVLKQVEAARIETQPFPYMVIDNILPDDYYQLLQQHFPVDGVMRSLPETGRTVGNAYQERMVTLFEAEDFALLPDEQRQFWAQFGAWLYSRRFIDGILTKLRDYVEPRLQEILQRRGVLQVRGDALVVSDKTRYAIGPHTDAPHRLVTFLFYLPQTERFKQYGTSFYVPKDPDFRCAGGPHHGFEPFWRVHTVDFVPNRLLVFVKNDQSFHGVEQINDPDVERHLLINNIRLLEY